jgi:ubiquinone/menaquinone biosynthesis C-methylase UbiE
MDQRQLAAAQFGDTAANYLQSSVHASGADLQRLEALARGARCLDLGCGAGHASFALARGGAIEVVSHDLSEKMLAIVSREAKERGHAAIRTERGSAEALPFTDDSFDLITTRYSAHHWPDVPAALLEVTRILKPGGRLIVIDVTSPEPPLLDTTLQALEVLRDRSHVRDYRASEWRAMLSKGLQLVGSDAWKLPLEFTSWVARIATPPHRIEALKAFFAELPLEARDYYAVADDCSFTIDVHWFEARKKS